MATEVSCKLACELNLLRILILMTILLEVANGASGIKYQNMVYYGESISSSPGCTIHGMLDHSSVSAYTSSRVGSAEACRAGCWSSFAKNGGMKIGGSGSLSCSPSEASGCSVSYSASSASTMSSKQVLSPCYKASLTYGTPYHFHQICKNEGMCDYWEWKSTSTTTMNNYARGDSSTVTLANNNKVESVTLSAADTPAACAQVTKGTYTDNMCMSWMYNGTVSGSAHNCFFYAHSGSATSTDEVYTYDANTISANVYCAGDKGDHTVSPHIIKMITAQGCMLQGINLAAGTLATTTTTTPHACRKECQEKSSCVAWTFSTASSSSNCALKSATSFSSWKTDSTSISGSHNCATCLDGYYIPSIYADSAGYDNCEKCARGYECAGGVLQACAANLYCGMEGITAAETYGADSNTTCSADRSGVGCQHRVCEGSQLGEILLGMAFEEPGNFDFSTYFADHISILQTLTDTDDNGYGIRSVQLIIEHSILPTFLSHISATLSWNLSKNSSQITAFPLQNFTCSTAKSTSTSMDLTSEIGSLDMGSDFIVEDLVMALKIGILADDDWFPTTTTDSTQSYSLYANSFESTLSFLAGIKATVNSFGGPGPRAGVTIYYTLGNNATVLTMTTESDGSSIESLLDTTAVGNTSTITIIAANNSLTDGYVKLCPLGTSECTSDYLEYPYSIELTYLKQETVYFVDTETVSLSGTIEIPFDNDKTCPGAGILVSAIDAASESFIVLATSITDASGTFALSISPTSVQLRFGTGLATWTPATSSSSIVQSLLSTSGYSITSGNVIAAQTIAMTSTSTLSMHAAATACDYDIGNVNVTVTVKDCPNIKMSQVMQGITDSWSLPATNYTFDISFLSPDDDVQASYELQFASEASRSLDLSSGNQTVDMIYQPVPVLSLEVATESAVVYPTCELGTLPFDGIVDGEQYVDFYATATQSYTDVNGNNNTCYTLPEGSEILLVSALNPNDDSDACNEDDPCAFIFNTTSSKSAANVTLYVGQPTNPPGNFTSTVTIPFANLTNYVRSASFRSFHPIFWPSNLTLTFQSIRILIIGNKVITSTEPLTFGNSVPLYYLYAPPIMQDSLGSIVSKATASFSQSISLESEILQQTEIENDSSEENSISVSVSALSGTGGSSSSTVGSEQVTSNTVSKNDVTVTSLSKFTFNEVTSGEDLVLLLGATANLTKSKRITYNIDSCSLTVAPSITWGSKTESLVVSSRSACEDSQQTVLETIALYKDNPDMSDVLADAYTELARWQNLFRHWDLDRLNALNYPVDLTSSNTSILGSSSIDGVNTLNLQGTSGEVTVSLTTSYTTNVLIDYASLMFSSSSSQQSENGLSIGFEEFLAFLFTSSQTSSSELTQTFKSTNSTYVDETFERDISTTFENSLGNNLCVQMFQSPYSGSFVYQVCGGKTRCPHVDGTEAIERFSIVEDSENPLPGVLSSSTGFFSFYLDLTDMEDNSLDVDLSISVDDASATGNIAYKIGATSLNSPFDITISKESTTSGTGLHKVVVQYERLDASIQSTSLVITVSSQCDSALSDSLLFTLNWENSCARPVWDGSLKTSGSTWALTSISPSLNLSYAFETNVTSSSVSVWAAKYISSSDMPGSDDFFQVGAFAKDETALILTGPDVGLSNETKYLLELRADCGSSNFVRSNPRLGVYDIVGPELVSWSSTTIVQQPMQSQTIATFRFDEPINCASSSLKAIVTDVNDTITANTSVSCTSLLYDLDVVLYINSSATAAQWSSSPVIITLKGVEDLYGNLGMAVEEQGSLRRLASEVVTVTKVIMTPDLPEWNDAEASSLPSWYINTTQISQYVTQAKEKALPSKHFVASSSLNSNTSNFDTKTRKVVAAVLIPVILVAAVIAGLIYYKRSKQPVRDLETGRHSSVVGHPDGVSKQRVHSLNPSSQAPAINGETASTQSLRAAAGGKFAKLFTHGTSKT